MGLTLVGATAIEDRLQVGVPETIVQLQQAGVRTWMLTGDKQETAINVAYAAHLISQHTRVVVIKGSSLKATRKLMAARYAALQLWLRRRDALPAEKRRARTLAIVFDGAALSCCAKDDALLRLCLAMLGECTAVIACRVSPAQKAEIIRLVKLNVAPSSVTLAIGDGGNDVAMIQEAHVGIGISGNEGMQAVRSSDYSIAQFAFLQRLLLAHGLWNYERICLAALYMVYKQ